MTNVDDKMYKVSVVATNGLNKVTKSMRLKFVDKKESAKFTFIPGQFVMLGVLGFGEAPLTITSAPSELPEFEVAVKSIGVATQAMHRLKVGDTLYVRGPMGNTIVSQKIYGKQLVLVAGGLGLAPLRSLIHAIRDDNTIVGNLQIVYGAKFPEDLLFKGELKEWEKFADVHITVDKADRQWTGHTGRVAEVVSGLKLDKGAVAVVCGPPIMYEGVAKAMISLGLNEENIEFMLERRMKCGIGKCQHCTCGEKYVCLDGPTFTWKELKDNWEAFK